MRSRLFPKTKLTFSLIITALAALGAFTIFFLTSLKGDNQTKAPMTLLLSNVASGIITKGTTSADPINSVKNSLSQLSETEPQEVISEVRRRVLGADPFLRKVKQFQTVVLPAQGDFVELQKMLSDTERILTARKELSWSGTLSRDATLRNMYQLDFLGMAISWQKNPARPMALESLEAIVTFEPGTIDSGEDEFIRAAERFEAASALFRHGSANFERLSRDNTTSAVRKILDEVRIRNQTSTVPLANQKG
jgi:hypothetical protein